jgi:phosphoglycolate phosphatase
VPTHLLLDLDGTLTDPRDGFVRCISHALAKLGRPAPAASDLEQYIGPPLAGTFRTLLDSPEERLIELAVAAYQERFSSTGIFENRVYPDIPSALPLLTSRGFTLCVVTSKPAVFAQRIVEHFGLAPHFARIYGPDLGDLSGTKSPLIRHALATERLVPADAVMIGDRRDDVAAAKANEVRSIGVTWGYGSRAELELAGADHIVDSVAELLLHLGTFSNRALDSGLADSSSSKE